MTSLKFLYQPAAAFTHLIRTIRSVFLCFFLVACGGSDGGKIRFEDRTLASGIDFPPDTTTRLSLLPEDVGSGAAWGDYDNDGDDDLFLIRFTGGFLSRERSGSNELFRNDGDFKFTKVTGEAGLVSRDWNLGGLWFDYDGDGWIDLAVSHFEGLRLYHNKGDGSFEDLTAELGLESYRRFFMGLCAADYDLDGDLDLFACGYVDFDRERSKSRPVVGGRPASWTNPVSWPAVPNLLLRNEGDEFVDVTEAAGGANEKGKSMQAVFGDFNNDSWPDLFVGNDVGTADALFINQGDGRFEDQAGKAGVLDYRAGMGIAVADHFHRGWLDLMVTHWVAEDHAMWKNVTESVDGKQVVFEDVAPALGLTPKPSAEVGWGCGLFDLDNDGFGDFFVVNGSTIEDELTVEVLSEPKLLPQTASVFWWDQELGEFVDASNTAGPFFSLHAVARGASFADVNQDGGMDVVVTYNRGGVKLLRNESPRGHWLQVRARGLGKNPNAVGATIQVRAGGVLYSEEIRCGSSYLGNDSLVAHFGLGEASTVDWVEVTFPGGKKTRVSAVDVDQRIEVQESN